MKELIGSPGTVSGLVLRIGQCMFAAAAIGVMVSAMGFSNYTAFWYLFFQFSGLCFFFLFRFFQSLVGFTVPLLSAWFRFICHFQKCYIYIYRFFLLLCSGFRFCAFFSPHT